jgi:FMN hydrolase / 5-amino-6-(5-phospho-D-ribitylamino)uracil phosphatase
VIEAVLFDGDQTLWDFERVMREALIAVLDELRAERPGPGTEALTWHDIQDVRAEVAEELAGIEFNLTRLRVLGFSRTLERVRAAQGGDETADAALAERIAASYFEHRDRDPALFPDTLPCLHSLRGRYRLGLLSNGSRLPERVGLAGYFETVVFAQDHRVAKPDKGIFEVVERELGVAPKRCVQVGDHPLNDVVGAKRAGWRAVWLNREVDGADAGGGDAFWKLHDDERPDAVVSSLSELPGALELLDPA